MNLLTHLIRVVRAVRAVRTLRPVRAALLAWLILVAFLAPTRGAYAGPLLELPDFDALADKASESVNITLDSALLGLATRFLDADDPADAAARDAIAGIKGIYVRSYSFDTDLQYSTADVERVRRQLSAPGWTRLVEVRSRRERTAVDIYVSLSNAAANTARADGLAIIASEPRQFTIVNIVGAIDLDKLHKLQGHFGVPDLELESGSKVDASKVDSRQKRE